MKQKPFKPRSIINKDVAGIRGVARMTDKARAANAGEIGAYKYGTDSQLDTRILFFLDISSKAFQEAAVRITNDIKLGAWILDHCNRSDEEIKTFNRQLITWLRNNSTWNHFSKRRHQLATNRKASYAGGYFWFLLVFWDIFC